MTPYIDGICDASPLYSLYAVVVHLDIMNAAFSGHYVCYVKNINGEWFRIDDSTVSSVGISTYLILLVLLALLYLIFSLFFFFFLLLCKYSFFLLDLENRVLYVLLNH